MSEIEEDLNPDVVLAKYHNTILKAANKFSVKSPRFDFEDLVEEGRIAAISAAKSFDKAEGTKFITFLTNSLDRELYKFVGDNAFDIDVSEYYRRKEFEEHGSLDSLKKKAKAIRLDIEGPKNSGGDSPINYHNAVPSGDPSPPEGMIRAENIQILREEMKNLPDRERLVLEKRYLDGLTLREIAEHMDVTKQTIHGWEKKGFDRLSKRVKARLDYELY
jgi:RNA polymerase sigma factor (sigma-70 family)